MIRAIIFDCFGVLTNDPWKQLREEYLGTDAVKLDRAAKIDQLVNTGKTTFDNFAGEVALLCGITKAEVLKRFDDPTSNDELFNFIAQQLKPHYKIGLLSNTAENWLTRLFSPEQLGVFDATVLSFETGHAKPSLLAYADIASALQIKSQECVYIDDRDVYVTAAEQFGMRGVVYVDNRQISTELQDILAL
jgi:FMN phosphatase YigB (HAD superfamily)